MPRWHCVSRFTALDEPHIIFFGESICPKQHTRQQRRLVPLVLRRRFELRIWRFDSCSGTPTKYLGTVSAGAEADRLVQAMEFIEATYGVSLNREEIEQYVQIYLSVNRAPFPPILAKT